MKALIFAAGLGTRLYPLTLNQPKALVEINGVTLLELAIRKLEAAGVTDIIINVHAFGDQIIDFIHHHSFASKISISDERGELLDTGGGLMKAISFFDDNHPFFVYNVDIITTADLTEFYQAHLRNGALVSLMIRSRTTARKLLFNNKMQLSGWRNKETLEEILLNSNDSDLSEYAFSGIHVVDPKIAAHFPSNIHSFSLIPFYLEVAKGAPIKGFVENNSLWFDVGKPAQLKEAEERMLKI